VLRKPTTLESGQARDRHLPTASGGDRALADLEGPAVLLAADRRAVLTRRDQTWRELLWMTRLRMGMSPISVCCLYIVAFVALCSLLCLGVYFLMLNEPTCRSICVRVTHCAYYAENSYVWYAIGEKSYKQTVLSTLAPRRAAHAQAPQLVLSCTLSEMNAPDHDAALAGQSSPRRCLKITRSLRYGHPQMELHPPSSGLDKHCADENTPAHDQAASQKAHATVSKTHPTVTRAFQISAQYGDIRTHLHSRPASGRPLRARLSHCQKGLPDRYVFFAYDD